MDRQLCCLCEKNYVSVRGRAICTPGYIEEDDKQEIRRKRYKGKNK